MWSSTGNHIHAYFCSVQWLTWSLCILTSLKMSEVTYFYSLLKDTLCTDWVLTCNSLCHFREADLDWTKSANKQPPVTKTKANHTAKTTNRPQHTSHTSQNRQEYRYAYRIMRFGVHTFTYTIHILKFALNALPPGALKSKVICKTY